MQAMLNHGASRNVNEEELKGYAGAIHYINQRAVIKPQSLSTPFRIVFNSSANFCGHILNDYWAKGPDMLINLLGLLLRFREGLYVLVGGIHKMCHTVKLSMIDQHTHRFFWQDLDLSSDPATFVMTSVSFGDRPAAAMATLALKKTAEMNMKRYPRAATIILSNTYVDDIVDSLDSKEQCEKVPSEIEQILQTGNFKIKEWHMSELNTENDVLNRLLNVNQKVLGMFWDVELDAFRFKSDLSFATRNKWNGRIRPQDSSELCISAPEQLTKRCVLSQVNSIYDPMGLLAPFIIKAKILMKGLWMNENKKLEWDDPLPEGKRVEWCKLFEEVSQLHTITFPRCLKTPDCQGDPIMILFCDGSENAYGTCTYIRWKTKSDLTLTRLIAAKCRVALMKATTIVRIELAGALLASRLFAFLTKECRIRFAKTYFLTDSQIVYSMIQRDSYGLRLSQLCGLVRYKRTPNLRNGIGSKGSTTLQIG